ncbi:MAG: diguanylate cyclase, partial [Leptospiraceae bacterium]|nr:diguanylate cyclase [Leptospiraceae bacterium]
VFQIDPIVRPGEPSELSQYGLYLEYDLASHLERTESAYRRYILFFVAAMFGISVLSWFVLSYVLTRRIARLVYATRNYTPGQNIVQVDESGRDEISVLNREFNRMMKQIDAYSRELQLSATVFENTSESILVLDETGMILRANSAFCELTGFAHAEVLGRQFLNFLSAPNMLASTLQTVRHLRRSGAWKGEITFRHKDGSESIQQTGINQVDQGDLKKIRRYAIIATNITELKQVQQSLQELAIRDGLTDLYNRRHFETILASEWQRAHRLNFSVAAVMIDIDFFKNYNDFYGHQKGDECIQRIAAELKSTFRRATDYVARYGGEEFIVLLTGDELPAVIEQVERLRSGIRQLRITHAKSSVAGCVTISAG